MEETTKSFGKGFFVVKNKETGEVKRISREKVEVVTNFVPKVRDTKK